MSFFDDPVEMLARLEALQQRKQDQENYGRFSTISGEAPTGGGVSAPMTQFQIEMPRPPSTPMPSSTGAPQQQTQQPAMPSSYTIPTGGTGAGQSVPVVWRGLPAGTPSSAYSQIGTGSVSGAPSLSSSASSAAGTAGRNMAQSVQYGRK